MELPFTVVFEPPSPKELRALLRMRGHWVAGLIVALAIGTAYALSNVAQADAVAAGAAAPLQLTSDPPGASVWVDGRQRGATPVDLTLQTGPHALQLKRPGTLDADYSVVVGPGVSTFHAVLWNRAPSVMRLRPALPGAELVDVRLLEDGTLGLAVVLAPEGEVAAWRLDPGSGALQALLDPVRGAHVAFAPDGRHLAYLGSEVGPWAASDRDSSLGAAPRQSVVWLVDTDDGTTAARLAWHAPLEPAERLIDVSWSPDARHVLVVAAQDLGQSAIRSRIWIVDADATAATQVATLPSGVVAGTQAWSPDGRYVAFVAHAGQVNALCLLGLDGTFQYVADLNTSAGPPLAYPAASWSADGQRMVFVAPHQHPPGVAFDWLTPDTTSAVYAVSPDQHLPEALADSHLGSVVQREDGQLLGVWRPDAQSALRIGALALPSGTSRDLLELPLKAPEEYGAEWDLAHAQLVVVGRTLGGSLSFWLARLAAEHLP